MTEISCYYIHSNINTRFIIFIKYKKYFRISIDDNKYIILSNETFMKISKLFEYYILSLLTTQYLNKIKIIDNMMVLKVEMDWKINCYTDIYIKKKKSIINN